MTKIIDERVDIYSFLFLIFSMKFQDPARQGAGAPVK